MFRILCLGLLLSTTLLWAQPVEGPWVVMEADTNHKWPHIIGIESDQTTVLYAKDVPDSDRICSITCDWESLSVTEHDTLYTYPAAWKTIVTDVELDSNGRWIAAIDHRVSGPADHLYLLFYDGSALHNRFVDSAVWWTYGWCTVIEWFQEYKVTSRPTGWGWSVGAGHTNPFECFPVVTPHVGVTFYWTLGAIRSVGDQTYGGATYVTSAWGDSGCGAALVTSNSFFNNPDGTLLVLASDSATWIAPPIHVDSTLSSLDARFNHSNELLVISGSSASYPAPVVVHVDSNGACQERSVLDWTGNPTATAWHSDYGFAIIRQTSNELQLFRTNAAGEPHLNDDVFYSIPTDRRIVSTDAQISPTGTLYVVWSEFTTVEPYISETKMLRAGWDMPLATNPQPERTAVRHYELQTYPNPFNASTTLSFTLPIEEDVNLRVYDIAGRLVKTLVDQERMAAGDHRFTFDAAGLPSGIYLCRLRAGEQSALQKLVLLR